MAGDHQGDLFTIFLSDDQLVFQQGLHLPQSITSAAFTLRSQYTRYLYPYECAQKNLSQPSELQTAIESHRREGRRQGYEGLQSFLPPGSHHFPITSSSSLPPLPQFPIFPPPRMNLPGMPGFKLLSAILPPPLTFTFRNPSWLPWD